MEKLAEKESVTRRTTQMIEDLKTICANFGLGGSPGEYKIITQVFLYKYLNDKFLYEAKPSPMPTPTRPTKS